MFSFGDIDNYGDILFAHIFDMEMRRRFPGVRIDHYAPTTAVSDGIEYIAYQREKVDGRYDALVLAGGEVVHFFDDRTWRPLYARLNRVVESGRPSDVVWDWAHCRAPYKAWFSVGVRPFEDQFDEDCFRSVLDALDHLSVRGALSKKILEQGAWNIADPRITMTPDLGWIFPRFLAQSGEKGRHHQRITGGEQDYVLFQVNNINEEEASVIGTGLRAFQDKYGVKVLLLPVIHPWEDVKYLRLIAERSNGELALLPDRSSVLEMADLMVHAQVVLCSSLHTAITALAAGVPAAVMNKWQGTKLQDLFGHQFRLEHLSNDPAQTLPMLEKLWKEREDRAVLKAYASFMELAVDRAFDDLAAGVRKANDL